MSKDCLNRTLKNKEVRKLREPVDIKHLNLEIVCDRISKWCDKEVLKFTDKRQIDFWLSQELVIPSRRKILFSDGTQSAIYNVVQNSGVTKEISEHRKQEGRSKASEKQKGTKCKINLEGAAIKAFINLLKDKLPEIYIQLEFQAVYDGLYADQMVRFKNSDKWSILQFKSGTWKDKERITYLSNANNYTNNIYVICIGIDNLKENIVNADIADDCNIREIFFIGNSNENIDTNYMSSICNTKSKYEKYRVYTDKQNILESQEQLIKLGSLINNLLTFIKTTQFTRHEILYKFDTFNRYVSVNVQIEKLGFFALENALKNTSLRIRAPNRQEETVDFILYDLNNIKNTLCISGKTGQYKEINVKSYSYNLSVAQNRHLCDYVFVLIKDLNGNFESVAIIDANIGYPENKKKFYWSELVYPEIMEKQTFKLDSPTILYNYINILFKKILKS